MHRLPTADEARRATDCGAARLVEARRGDLLGLPFLMLAIGLSIFLIVKIARPGAGESGPPRSSIARPDDAMM